MRQNRVHPALYFLRALIAGKYQLTDKDLLGQVHQAPLSRRDAAAPVLQDKIACHSGNITDIAALHAVQIGMESLVPASLRAFRLGSEHVPYLVHFTPRDDVPQADMVGIVRWDHDLHVSHRHLEDIVGLAFAQDFTILDSGNHTGSVHRIYDFITYL